MATFTGKPTIINRSATDIASRFSDLSILQSSLDTLPAEEREKIGEVTFEKNSITIHTPQVGDIALEVTELSTSRITFTAKGSPVPMTINVNLKAIDPETTEVTTSMDVDIPMFLKPMIGGALQKAVDQFGGLMEKLV